MSFGGGTTQYILEYIVKVTNQGGATASGPLNQLNASTQQVTESTTQLTASQDKLKAAHERVTQAGLGVSKAAKGMAFGFIGIATAGAEAVGMLSMYQSTQAAVTEAQAAQSAALKEGGKNTKDYKDATNELVKAQRWQRMTQRNLMLSMFDLVPFIVLSVNGILKLRTALKMAKEAKEAENALKALGTSSKALATANTAAQVSSLGLGKSVTATVPPLTKFKTAQMAANVATTASVGGFKNQSIALGTATNASTAMATSTTKLSKAMRVLSIAMKVAIPLAILEIASQAFQNNWGGFADKINAVGKAFGDAVPAAKGFLDIIGKVGKTVVAVFTGNWEDIGAIWDSTAKDVVDTTKEMTDKQRKEMEKLNEDILDMNNQAFKTLQDAAGGDKKERNLFMKSFGLDKGARKEMSDTLKEIDNIHKAMVGFHNALDTMRTLNLMQKLGLDVPNQAWKDVAAGLSDTFSKLGKSIKGNDMFDEFAKTMEKASHEKGPAVIKAIMSFMQKNPQFMPYLIQAEPELAKQLTTMLNEAGIKVDANGMVANVQKQVQSAFSAGGGLFKTGAGSGAEGVTTFDKNGKPINTPNGGGGGAGPLQGLVDSITNGLKEASKLIQGADWNSIGLAIRAGLATVFTKQNAQWMGQQIRVNLVDPLFVTLGAVFREAAAQFQKDPLGFIGATTVAHGDVTANFTAGLLGFSSKEALFEEIINFFENTIPMTLRVAWTNFTDKVKEIFKNPLGVGQADQVPGAGTILGPLFTSIFGTAGQVLQQAANYINTNVIFPITTAWQNIHGEIGNIMVSSVTVVNQGFEWLLTSLESILGTPGQILQQAGNWINTNVIFSITTAWDNGMKALGTSLSSLVEGINTGFSAGADWITKLLDSAFGSISNFTSEITQWVVDNIEQPIIDAINVAIQGINDTVIKDLNNFQIAGVHPIHIDEIQLIPDAVSIDDAAIKKALANTSFDNVGQSGASTAGSFNQAEGGMRKGGGPQLSIPSVTLKPKAAVVNINDIQGGSMGGCGAMGGGFGGLGGCQLPMDTITVAPKIVKVNSQGSTLDFGTMVDDASASFIGLSALAQSVFSVIAQNATDAGTAVAIEFSKTGKKVNKIFSALSTHWNSMVVNMAKASSKGANTIAKNFSSGMTKSGKAMSNLSTHWNSMALNMAKASSKAANTIAKNIGSGMTKSGKAMSNLSKHWNQMCNNMVSAAKNAASQINSAIQGIKDKVVHVTVERGGALAKGGLMSFAQGGMISAARGRLLTTSGPQVYTLGDNPGGRESVWAIPHNNPFPTMNKIDAFYGRGSKSGGGSMEFNGLVQLNISGNDIINDKKLNRRIRMTVGESRDRFG